MQPAAVQFIIREEQAADREGIRQVHRLAFKTDDEGALVDRLRADGLVVVSMVAEIAGNVVGHILFSRLPIETQSGMVQAIALAPVAVKPSFQLKGIGSSLIRRGLALCRDRAVRIVLVVGHPDYYPRFGFSAETAKRLKSSFSGPMFMALELVPGALDGIVGTVRYPTAFDTMQ